jgi:hypothetical protein
MVKLVFKTDMNQEYLCLASEKLGGLNLLNSSSSLIS